MKSLEHMTHTERLAEVLVLAITAPEGRTAEADALAHQFAAFCTPQQIEDAQAAALAVMEARSCA